MASAEGQRVFNEVIWLRHIVEKQFGNKEKHEMEAGGFIGI